MKVESKVSGKDLRAISGFNMIINISKELEGLKTELADLDITDIKDSKIPLRVKQLRAIMGTAGNEAANKFLIYNINELDYELNKRFLYLPLIKKKMEDTSQAFNIATGAHFQGYEKIKQRSVAKALGGSSLLDEPTVTFGKSKRQDGNRIESD